MMSSFLAPSARSTSSSSGSMLASPVATFTTIGKNEIRKAVSTAGTMPMPNQMIRIGTTATLGIELKPIIGIEAAIDRARPADDDAQHDAERDGKGKTRKRRPQRDEGVLAERKPVLADGLKYLRGRGQHEGVDFENAAHQLPEHEHGNGEQPGR